MRPPAEAELEALYRRYRADVYRYALSASRDENEADEVTQAAFLSAYRALARGGTPRRPRAWLLTIAENVRRRRLRRPRESPLPESYEAPVHEPDVTTEELLAAIRALPESQRRALILRELAGRSYDEIASELKTSIGAVQMLLFRARRELRERLKRVAAIPAPFWFDGGAGAAGPALRTGAVAVGAVALALGTGGGAAPPAAAPIVDEAKSRLVAPPAPALRTAGGTSQPVQIQTPARRTTRAPVPAQQAWPTAPAQPGAAAPGSAAPGSAVPGAAALQPEPAQPTAANPIVPTAGAAVAPAPPATPTVPLPPVVPAEAPGVPPEAPLELPALPVLPPLPEAPALPELGGAQLP